MLKWKNTAKFEISASWRKYGFNTTYLLNLSIGTLKLPETDYTASRGPSIFLDKSRRLRLPDLSRKIEGRSSARRVETDQLFLSRNTTKNSNEIGCQFANIKVNA